MIRFKNNVGGFTLIEAMLAVAIVALVMTPLFILQNRVFLGVTHAGHTTARFIAARNFLIETAEKNLKKDVPEFTLEKKIEDPLTFLKYEIKPVTKESAIGKKFNNVHKESVTFTWQDGTATKKDTLVSFMYRPKSTQS